MLTDINLDNENFEDLAEEARNLAVSEYPEWTDFNYHDPGITMSELFALLKEIAQYRMNFIGDLHRVKYLKLLGIERRHLRPAEAPVTITCPRTRRLPALTRFYASDICFESKVTEYLVAGDLYGCVCEYQGGLTFWDRRMLEFTKTMRIPVFGAKPAPGNCFYIMFGEPLPVGLLMSMYAEVYNRYEVPRNPLDDEADFAPLAVMQMEYFRDGGWHACGTFLDATRGFLQDGWLRFSLPQQMDVSEIAGHRGYFLRLRLTAADYDVAPLVTRIGMNFVDLMQTRHYACCQDEDCTADGGFAVCRIEANDINTQHLAVLLEKDGAYTLTEEYDVELQDGWLTLRFPRNAAGELPERVRILAWEEEFDRYQIVGDGDGLPDQTYLLPDVSVDEQRVRLMIGEADAGGALREWTRVEDFTNSGPSDRHYRIDRAGQQLIFGDCIHGMAPEGRILITQFVSSEGQAGNVKAGRINRIEEGYEELLAVNENNAFGGRDEELLEESFMRAKRAIYDNRTLVTDEDYENAVRRTPGLMIENCRVLHPDASNRETELHNRVTVVVKPYSEEKNPKLSPVYIRNIQAWLEPVRTAGTEILLLSPDYVKLNLFVECKGRSSYINDRKEITEALTAYFRSYGRNFGGVISYSEVYELLDRLDAVEVMEALSIDVIGSKVGRAHGGDIILPANGLVSVGDIQYNININ